MSKMLMSLLMITDYESLNWILRIRSEKQFRTSVKHNFCHQFLQLVGWRLIACHRNKKKSKGLFTCITPQVPTLANGCSVVKLSPIVVLLCYAKFISIWNASMGVGKSVPETRLTPIGPLTMINWVQKGIDNKWGTDNSDAVSSSAVSTSSSGLIPACAHAVTYYFRLLLTIWQRIRIASCFYVVPSPFQLRFTSLELNWQPTYAMRGGRFLTRNLLLRNQNFPIFVQTKKERDFGMHGEGMKRRK